jgi:hypothetical protein
MVVDGFDEWENKAKTISACRGSNDLFLLTLCLCVNIRGHLDTSIYLRVVRHWAVVDLVFVNGHCVECTILDSY